MMVIMIMPLPMPMTMVVLGSKSEKSRLVTTFMIPVTPPLAASVV
jgi:hypothetical protein